ncbi:MAG: hypothetical protein JSU01_04670 [Bacteroidetes bacterium]|nr:hypothetical protein [Bacteroidota bacterium]
MNFNQTLGKSFNIDFCQRLEYHLSHTLRNAGIGQIKYFWCDGIEVPEKFRDVRNSKQIMTAAWLGITGQDKYQMTITLGEKAFEKCSDRSDITDCLPDDQSLEWIDIDPINKVAVLQLL